jgi:hypothetical protein
MTKKAIPATEFDLVGSVMAWENGEMDQDQTVEFFQHLVDTGLAWQFQGIYGRTAKDLIRAGLVTEPA